MQNDVYWKKRFKQLEKAQNSTAIASSSYLQKQYTIAQKEIEKEIAGWYQRFAVNNQISMKDARKLLTTQQLAEFKWDVAEYIKHGREAGASGQWIKELENASARFHVSRLEALKLQTQQVVETLYGKETAEITKLLKQTYLDGYYHTAYEIQKGFNLGWNISAINESQLEKILSKPWSATGTNFSTRIWDSKAKLITETQTQLTQNIIMGRSPDASIQAIAKRFDVSKNQAARLVMTESSYFSNQSQKECFKALNVSKFEVVGTLDNTTCSICGAFDGYVDDMTNYQAGVTAPPYHPWCRCTTVPYFDDQFGERAARQADGDTYYVPANMKYKDWKNSFVDGGSKDGLIKVDKDDIITASTIDQCTTVAEVEHLLREKEWFLKTTINGKDVDYNLTSTLAGCDLETAKSIYKRYEKVYTKYPQLIGKVRGINASSLKAGTYAQCNVGTGRGGITVSTLYYSDARKLAKTYEKDVAGGYHPAGTTWESILTHEFGHTIDDFLSNKLYLFGMKNHWEAKYASAALRPKVMKACGMKVSDAYKEVSGYASKDHFEWFAECFAEYMDSPQPRRVAQEFGRTLDEIMKGVK